MGCDEKAGSRSDAERGVRGRVKKTCFLPSPPSPVTPSLQTFPTSNLLDRKQILISLDHKENACRLIKYHDFSTMILLLFYLEECRS